MHKPLPLQSFSHDGMLQLIPDQLSSQEHISMLIQLTWLEQLFIKNKKIDYKVLQCIHYHIDIDYWPWPSQSSSHEAILQFGLDQFSLQTQWFIPMHWPFDKLQLGQFTSFISQNSESDNQMCFVSLQIQTKYNK